MRAFLLALQVTFLLCVVAGATLIFWPAGLIVFGVLGAAVIERQT